MSGIEKQRYNLLESITDAMSGYMISGTIVAWLGGGFWLLHGLAVLLVVLLAFSMYRTRLKIRLYSIAQLVYLLSLAGLYFTDKLTVGGEIWLLLIAIGIIQATLVLLYRRRQSLI